MVQAGLYLGADGDGSLTISPTNGVSGTLNGLSSVDKAKVTKIVVDNEVMMSNDYNRILLISIIVPRWICPDLIQRGHKDFGGMFENCKSLQVLNLSGFDTSAATSLSSMFSRCKKLTTLDLSDFNTSKVTNMFEMFKGCSELTALDVSSFTTANVRNMSEMFYNCSKLTELDLSNFNTTNVTNMRQYVRWMLWYNRTGFQ